MQVATLAAWIRRLYARSGVRRIVPWRVLVALRSGRVRTGRALGVPVSTPKLPDPALPPRRRPLRLARVLLACDLNRRYLDSWALVADAWERVVGVEALLVLVADEDDVPPELAGDERVHLFTPIPGLHTAFQAQCIRLLYPALLDADGAVLISDMELVPLDRAYFWRPLSTVDESVFVAYRDLALHKRQILIPYNAARPETWADVFGAGTPADVRTRLAAWGEGREYDAVRGGHGWYTDQELLYATVLPWGEGGGRFVMFDDEYTGFNRLDRPDVEDGLDAELRASIRSGSFTDFNSLVPHGEHRRLNEEVVELALAARERGTERRARSVGSPSASD